MPQGRLAAAEDIKLVDDDFKNQNWADAASDIVEFYEDGITTFPAMAERGEWSRAHYQKVFRQHFEAVGVADEDDRLTVEEFEDAFERGFAAGVDYVRDNPEQFGLEERD